MSVERFREAVLAAALALLAGAGAAAEAQLQPIPLPAPTMTGGMPLMDALTARRSDRELSADPLSLQRLSDLLWAGVGVNRPDSGKRTAPSARNWQDLDLYVVMARGAYRYDAAHHRLEPVAAGDLRGVTGSQPFVKDVPVNLVYVSDGARMTGVAPDQRDLYAGMHAGLVSQNVSLYCASAGLGTVVRGLVDREAVAAALSLRPEQRVCFAQSVGHRAAPSPDERQQTSSP